MKYAVLQGKDDSLPDACIELEKRVKQHLKHGWTPIGGVAVTKVPSSSKLFSMLHYVVLQAMVKND